ncbi:MAG: chromosome partitioning protein ParB, partial [Candidatus Onthomonas sp.]
MVDSNLQRENLLPSEKAFAYKMKLEAMKHQGKRNDLTSDRVGPKLAVKEIGAQNNDSQTQVKRYIRLTYLAKPILDLVDQQRIAFSPAVELSYLTRQEQAELWDIMQSEDCTPSLSQAVRLKKLSQKAELTPEKILDIMSEQKANQKDRVRIEVSQLRKYFPRNYTAHQMEQSILKLLEEQYRKKQRGRDAR